MRDFNKAISSNPEYFPPYSNIGYAYMQQNKPDNATKYFLKCLDHLEYSINPNLNLAIVYYMQGDKAKAKTYFDKAKQLEPRLSKGIDVIIEIEKKGYFWTDKDKQTLKKMFEELK
jgi:Tfp pilus assembly protein PilF